MKSHHPTWLRWRHRGEYLIFQTVACLFGMLSARAGKSLAESLAFFIFRVLPRKMTRYEVARNNIRTAFGDSMSDERVDEIIYGMWVHLFRMIVEILQLPRKLKQYNNNEILHYRDRTDVVKALNSDRPVILLSGHYGNWEMSVASFGLFGFPMAVVARPLDNPYLDAWFERFRRHTGHTMLGKRGAYNRMADVLARGGSIALLGDQDAGPRGVFVDFFGKSASTFPTIARLAVEYDAYICVGYSYRLPDDFENRQWVRFELGCEAVVDPHDHEGEHQIRDISQAFTTALEDAVRLAPEQYFWVHRRWKTRPEQAIGFDAQEARKAG